METTILFALLVTVIIGFAIGALVGAVLMHDSMDDPYESDDPEDNDS